MTSLRILQSKESYHIAIVQTSMLPPLCQSSIGVLGEEWSGFAPRSLEAPTLKDFSAGIWWTLIFGTGTLLLVITHVGIWG
ncbi:hypothetical protein CICLE_v10003016mg [Citrus x clementina]|uniref:Uncharacterized protein n=1 Tax=Citrus clementina TaxID=85681 RepID=V4SZQ5_CITCL|nr:hypothetical protein CICLE_v10003016mg [Citrus x clementina]